ncbi:ATP-binding protein [Streptomyces lavendulae subsp. lavendulae]|nr:ATP-binding protein [Streptomyces lavendulae subsp. lavendulae]GLX30757.1 ATP-binding protein [Streptomyces lavendulae subsp. lavendulae]
MGLPPSAVSHGLDLDDASGAAGCGAGIAWIRRTLTDMGLLAHGGDVVLVAAELLSNAVRHAGGARHLSLDRHDRFLRIAVSDHDPRPPRMGEHRPDSIGGHGLFLVDRLALRWGSRPAPGGKTVWADLPLPPP